MIQLARSAHPVLALAVGAALSAACASTTPFQRAVRLGRVEEAARLFDADSTLWHDDAALYHVAAARATPGSPVYEPALARQELDALLRRFPGSPHRADALRLDSLLVRLDRLARDTVRLSLRADSLARHADSLEAQIAAQHRASQELIADLRRTEARLRAVQDELDRLKAIDLRLDRRPRPPHSP